MECCPDQETVLVFANYGACAKSLLHLQGQRRKVQLIYVTRCIMLLDFSYTFSRIAHTIDSAIVSETIEKVLKTLIKEK